MIEGRRSRTTEEQAELFERLVEPLVVERAGHSGELGAELARFLLHLMQVERAAVKQLAEDSRKHAGNLTFDVWQQTNRPNHFTVVESWANRGAFDVHEMQKETREFRMKLGPMSGALYDERLYKVLVR